jgi:hypothetical protein
VFVYDYERIVHYDNLGGYDIIWRYIWLFKMEVRKWTKLTVGKVYVSLSLTQVPVDNLAKSVASHIDGGGS